jgi:hypothetical protein
VKPGVERVVPADVGLGTMPLFELRVDLEDGPTTSAWVDLFKSSPIVKAGDRSMMESEPALVGSVVTWTVSQPSLPHAERFIRRRIEWANERFSSELHLHVGVDQPQVPQVATQIPPRRQAVDQRETDAVRWFLDRHRRRNEIRRVATTRSPAGAYQE